MSGILISATARVLETARAQFETPASWPDPASGFAYRLLQAAQLLPATAFKTRLRATSSELLRRAPELAAFGYVMAITDPEVQLLWAKAFERLMSRDPFPSDRNSFIHSPLELIGIAFGTVECPMATDVQRLWLLATIQRGLRDREFIDVMSQAAVACAECIVNKAESGSINPVIARPPEGVATRELVFVTALRLLISDRAAIDAAIDIDIADAEDEIVRRVLATGVPAQDAAEAASLYVMLKRAIDRIATVPHSDTDPITKITALCRRFPLFAERLKSRQRGRQPFEISDEYDVQDLLHAVLKLHFDDVRPEEWAPSYAANSSRVDFLLPRERAIIETKMTRSNLGQREGANELIIDAARYAKFPQISHLVCLIYDPGRHIGNASALENDLGQSDGRLRVVAIVCPRGT
jgi:hypothetical protein